LGGLGEKAFLAVSGERIPLTGRETATFTLGDVVKSNIKKASYKIIVDSQNWIKESNEVNNEKSESLQLQ